MKRREKEINNQLKNAVKRKSNSYNRQQMKSKIKIENKKKTNTQRTRKQGNQHNQNQFDTAQMKSKNNTQTYRYIEQCHIGKNKEYKVNISMKNFLMRFSPSRET